MYHSGTVRHSTVKAPVNDILVSAPESASSKTRAGGSLLPLCHYLIASSYVVYYDTIGYNQGRRKPMKSGAAIVGKVIVFLAAQLIPSP